MELFCPVLKSGRLVGAGDDLGRLSPAAAWKICQERGLNAQIQAPAPHDLRLTWIGDLLDLGVDLATVQKMAGHASASTTSGYDRRDRGMQRRAAALLYVPTSARRIEEKPGLVGSSLPAPLGLRLLRMPRRIEPELIGLVVLGLAITGLAFIARVGRHRQSRPILGLRLPLSSARRLRILAVRGALKKRLRKRRQR